jgi:hypothetical protein
MDTWQRLLDNPGLVGEDIVSEAKSSVLSLAQVEALQQANQRTLKGQCPENEKPQRDSVKRWIFFLIEYNIRFPVSLTQMEALQQAPQRWTFKGTVSGD